MDPVAPLVRYDQSIQDPEGFWSTIAQDLSWMQPFTKVMPESNNYDVSKGKAPAGQRRVASSDPDAPGPILARCWAYEVVSTVQLNSLRHVGSSRVTVHFM